MIDYATLTATTEKKLRECADAAAELVDEVSFRQRLDMGHGIWQLWLALAANFDKDLARNDMDRLYALIEPVSVTGLKDRK